MVLHPCEILGSFLREVPIERAIYPWAQSARSGIDCASAPRKLAVDLKGRSAHTSVPKAAFMPALFDGPICGPHRAARFSESACIGWSFAHIARSKVRSQTRRLSTRTVPPRRRSPGGGRTPTAGRRPGRPDGIARGAGGSGVAVSFARAVGLQ